MLGIKKPMTKFMNLGCGSSTGVIRTMIMIRHTLIEAQMIMVASIWVYFASFACSGLALDCMTSFLS